MVLNNNWKGDFNIDLKESLDNNKIVIKSDVEKLFEAFKKSRMTFLPVRIKLRDALNHFLFSFADLENEKRNLINGFIDEENEMVPFRGVSYEEGVALTAIYTLLKINCIENKEVIEKLKNLGKVMAKRNKKEKITKWSLIIAIIGVIATIATFLAK